MDRLSYISKEAISPKAYNNSILEWMTRVHPLTPYVVFIPVSIFFVVRSIMASNGQILLHFLWMIPTITIFWTFLEFLLHITVLHNEKAGVVAKIHETHHQYPNDPLRLSVPLWSSIPGGIVFYFGFRLIVGPDYIDAFFGILVAYYILYEFTHLTVHQYNWKNPLFQKIKKHHLKHHFHNPQKGFGFTTTIWDKIFKKDF
jgi:sterol desaturase/sphingolipid hydroxylase (fatty acid hydroxylase superfamily)